VALFDPGCCGCPTEPIRIVWAAYEPFAAWGDVVAQRQQPHLSDGGGRDWAYAEEAWDGRDLAGRGQPPAGLFALQRGFGYVWEVRDEVFAQFGMGGGSGEGVLCCVAEL
jgi:hypothetical protein